MTTITIERASVKKWLEGFVKYRLTRTFDWFELCTKESS